MTYWSSAEHTMADPLIVKICGIKTLDILETTIAAGADMVGFMHFPRSPRHVSVEQIADLISSARGRIQTCVVLVNPDNSGVAEIAALGPDWIQLHGPETPHRVEAIRNEAGVEIMKAPAHRLGRGCRPYCRFRRGRRPHPARCQAPQGRGSAGRIGRNL
jgi:hypothetical protein